MREAVARWVTQVGASLSGTPETTLCKWPLEDTQIFSFPAKIFGKKNNNTFPLMQFPSPVHGQLLVKRSIIAAASAGWGACVLSGVGHGPHAWAPGVDPGLGVPSPLSGQRCPGRCGPARPDCLWESRLFSACGYFMRKAGCFPGLRSIFAYNYLHISLQFGILNWRHMNPAMHVKRSVTKIT